MTTHISNAARNAACDSVVDLVDGGAGAGKIRIYNGSQPAGPDTAVSGQTLLAEITVSDPAFGSASAGVATLSGTPLSGTGAANGTATWFRMLDSNNLAVLDGSVGTSGAELNLNTTTISTGVTVQVTSGTVTMPG